MKTTSTTPGVVQSDSKLLNYFTRLIVILVAAGAAILSFDALTALAQASGIRIEFSWIWAVVIDGFIMVATFAAFALKDRSGKSKYYAWVTLGLFVMLSILGNAWHAVIEQENYILPIWVAVLVTAIPPLALFLAIHLLILMVSPSHEQKEEHKKHLEQVERLNKIKEREIEKIEKLAAINEVREEAGLEPLVTLGNQSSSTRRTTTPRVEKAATVKTPSKPVKAPEAQEPEVASTEPTTVTTEPKEAASGLPVTNELTYDMNSNVLKSEDEVTSLLMELVQNGEKLPTGKTISEWLGKSERTGQMFLKNFRESKLVDSQ
jgi:hypothetical protein